MTAVQSNYAAAENTCLIILSSLGCFITPLHQSQILQSVGQEWQQSQGLVCNGTCRGLQAGSHSHSEVWTDPVCKAAANENAKW